MEFLILSITELSVLQCSQIIVKFIHLVNGVLFLHLRQRSKSDVSHNKFTQNSKREGENVYMTRI